MHNNYFMIMKFLEYLICCTSSSISEGSPALQADNSKCIVPVLQPERSRYRDRRKCSSITSSKSGSATADWRPSLNVISEDNIVAVKRRNSCGSERTVKRKDSPMHKSKVRTSRSEDYGRDPIPGIIPAFAPTPFLF